MANIAAPVFTLASSVASPAGTVTFAYPPGYAQADFTGANASASAYIILNGNDRFEETDAEFDITYGSSDITITNKTGFAWAIGTTVLAGLGRASPSTTFQQAGAVPNLGGTLTGSTDGTLADVADIALSTTDTYTDAAVNAAVNAAVADVNLQLKELQTKLNAAITALRTAGIIAS